ncbi:hypothetical protein GCM10010199_12500 [Dactylosporangium roseum]
MVVPGVTSPDGRRPRPGAAGASGGYLDGGPVSPANVSRAVAAVTLGKAADQLVIVVVPAAGALPAGP